MLVQKVRTDPYSSPSALLNWTLSVERWALDVVFPCPIVTGLVVQSASRLRALPASLPALLSWTLRVERFLLSALRPCRQWSRGDLFPPRLFAEIKVTLSKASTGDPAILRLRRALRDFEGYRLRQDTLLWFGPIGRPGCCSPS